MKKALPLLTLPIVAGLALLLLLGGEDPGPEPTHRRTPRAQAEVASTAQDQRTEDPTPAAAAPTDVGEAPAPSEDASRETPLVPVDSPQTDALPEILGTLLVGSVVVTDPHGAKHTNVDGSFSILLWEGSGAVHQHVTVKGGRFETRIPTDPSPDSLSLGTLTLAGKPARTIQPTERFVLPADGRLDIEAAWARPSTLIVRDADTGLELQGIEVVQSRGWRHRDTLHPGPSTRLVARGASPLQLEPDGFLGRADLHVRAHGYAWSKLKVEFAHGGERVVALKRGASFELELVGAAAEPDAVLRLYAAGSSANPRPLCEISMGERRTLELSGVQAGEYTVRVEIGSWHSSPLSQGESRLTLTAGETTRARLALEPPPAVETTSASGELVIPSEWRIKRLRLQARSLEGSVRRRLSSKPHDDRPGVHRWELKDLPPGRYQIRLSEPPMVWLFEVPQEGTEDLRLELPPPVEVVVRIVDGEGRDFELPEISWHPKLPEGTRSWSSKDARPDPVTGRFRFRAPRGQVFLTHYGGKHSLEPSVLSVGPGVTLHTITARPTCGFVLRLRDGTTSIPWSFGWRVAVEALDGEGTEAGWGVDGVDRRVVVSEPGTYTVTFPGIDGFEPVPPQQIDVPPGTFAELVVPLQRR